MLTQRLKQASDDDPWWLTMQQRCEQPLKKPVGDEDGPPSKVEDLPDRMDEDSDPMWDGSAEGARCTAGSLEART